MVHNLLKQDMTVYELAQFMIDYCASKEDLKRYATKEDLERFATKIDLELSEKRLAQKIDNNYIHTNKRIDLIS